MELNQSVHLEKSGYKRQKIFYVYTTLLQKAEQKEKYTFFYRINHVPDDGAAQRSRTFFGQMDYDTTSKGKGYFLSSAIHRQFVYKLHPELYHLISSVSYLAKFPLTLGDHGGIFQFRCGLWPDSDRGKAYEGTEPSMENDG